MTVSQVLILTSLSWCVSAVFIFQYRKHRVVNFSVVAFLMIASDLVGWLQRNNGSVLWFLFSCVLCFCVIAGLSFLVSTFLETPGITRSAQSVIGLCVFLITLGVCAIAFPQHALPRIPHPSLVVSVAGTDLSASALVVTLTSGVILAIMGFVIFRSIPGAKFRAALSGSDYASTMGISRNYSNAFLSVLTGVLLTSSGIFFHVGNTISANGSPLYLSMAALAAAVVARQHKLSVAFIASCVMVVGMFLLSQHKDSVSRFLTDALHRFGLGAHALPENSISFVMLVVPIVVALCGLLISPLWNKERRVG